MGARCFSPPGCRSLAWRSAERGSALILAIILTLLLAVLGLGLASGTLTDFSMSFDLESRTNAFNIGETGVHTVQEALRGQNFSTLLSSSTPVPHYLTYTAPAPGSYAARNPITALMARSVDFRSPPQVVATPSLKGFFGPASGTSVGEGRYFARLSDNDDGDGDPEADADGNIFLRVVGLHPTSPGETRSYGTAIKNSVSVQEVLLRRDSTFAAQSPFTIIGPNINPASSSLFDGNSFLVDGFDHSNETPDQARSGSHNHSGETSPYAGITAIYDDPSGGDAGGTVDDIYNAMQSNQLDNVIGADGPYGSSPSLADGTDSVRNSTNPDATNLFDADFLADFVAGASTSADVVYNGNTQLSGGNVELGTDQNPQITVVNGDLDLSGGGSGSGLLIVTGALDYQGSFSFNGLILVVGEGEAEFGGVSKGIVGGLFVAKLVDDGNGGKTMATPALSIGGNSNFYFRGASVDMALQLVPLRTLSWREVVPEIEP